MKKITINIVMLILVSLLASCSPGKDSPNVILDSKGERIWTEDDVIQLFEDNKEDKSWEVTDCVVATDFAYDRVGVILYTDEHGQTCNLAFMKEDGSYQRMGIVASIAPDSEFVYRGGGQVSLRLEREDKSKPYTCRITFSLEEGEVSFKIEDVVGGKQK